MSLPKSVTLSVTLATLYLLSCDFLASQARGLMSCPTTQNMCGNFFIANSVSKFLIEHSIKELWWGQYLYLKRQHFLIYGEKFKIQNSNPWLGAIRLDQITMVIECALKEWIWSLLSTSIYTSSSLSWTSYNS